jgi:hypothetical protein
MKVKNKVVGTNETCESPGTQLSHPTYELLMALILPSGFGSRIQVSVVFTAGRQNGPVTLCCHLYWSSNGDGLAGKTVGILVTCLLYANPTPFNFTPSHSCHIRVRTGLLGDFFHPHYIL